MLGVLLVLASCSGDGTTGTTGTTGAVPSTTGGPAATTTTAPAPATTTAPSGTAVPATTTTPAPLERLAWEEVVDLGGFITGIEPHDGRALVTTKDGRIHDVVDDSASVVADLSGEVRDSGEQGLLDLALHPDGDRLFVHYSAGDGDTVLAELPYPGLDELTTLFRTRQPAGNHNGGSIEFGPDGMLYLALGDGGASNDRYGNGQRTDTPLGAVHRFDVSTEGVAVAAAGNPGFEIDSIWLYGVRNPWRIAFAGDLLIVADVGQNAWEEVTFLPADAAGRNLGWPIQEGRHCFSRTPCDDAAILMAQVEIAHGDDGTCSITGGEVYAGTEIPELVGHYLFSDYCGGWLRSVDTGVGIGDPADVVEWDAQGLEGPGVIAAGPDGELLAGGAGGRLLRLVPVR